MAKKFSDLFNAGEPSKQGSEIRFFSDIRDYQGTDAIQTLQDFVDQSKVQVDLKAKFYAFNKIQALYEWIVKKVKE